MCLNSPTLPFLPCFIAFCSNHSYTSYFYEIFATCSCTFFITKVYFFYVDYGILYEERLVRAKKHKSCCIYMIYSRTSDNGPSEKRTTSLQRTHSLLRNEITIVIVLKQPPRNGRFSIPDSGQELHSQLHFPIQNCL